jgi:hypothetical protein
MENVPVIKTAINKDKIVFSGGKVEFGDRRSSLGHLRTNEKCEGRIVNQKSCSGGRRDDLPAESTLFSSVSGSG